MAGIPNAFAVIWLAAILMVATFGTNLLATSSSMIVQFDHNVPSNAVDLNTDLAQLLRLKSKAAIKPFEKVLAKFTDVNQNKCDIETQFRFVTACQEFEGKPLNDRETAQVLEGVKSLYGIRKAICETSSSGTATPSACVVLLPSLTPPTSRKTMLASDLESAVSSSVSTCLREFQRHHYYWTSYSNNLQDANAVFDMLRSDVELRNIVMTYQDFAASIHGLEDELAQMREETLGWYANMSHKARFVLDLQDRVFSTFDAGFNNVSSTVYDHLHFIQSALRSHNLTLDKALLETKHDLIDLREEVIGMTARLTESMLHVASMHNNVATDLATFHDTQERVFLDTWNTVEDKLLAFAVSVNELWTDIDSVGNNVKDFARLQAEQLSLAHDQLNISDTVLLNQVKSNKLANETHNTMRLIFECAENLEGRVQTFASIVAFAEDNWDALTGIATYMLFSLVLRPFEGIRGLSAIASIFKAIYGISYATRLLWQTYEVESRLQSVKLWFEAFSNGLVAYLPDVWIAACLVVICLLVIFLCVVKPDRNNVEKFDLEKAVGSPHGVGLRPARMSSSQRKRLGHMPRAARHGTAPPGF